jgi:uncharacterized protein (DUF58 family)
LVVTVTPTHISGFVAEDFTLHIVIHNLSPRLIKLIDCYPKIPLQLKSGRWENRAYSLPGDSEFHTEVRLKALSPGEFSVTKWVLVSEDKAGLFTHNLSSRCRATVEVVPVLGRLEAKLQLGSLANLTRFGTGTDLAQIREVVSQDDFHSIDWKSTARTGKFMKKEYYPETEPAVLVVVDTSVLTRWSQVIVQLGKLLVTFLSSTPVGLILYDERTIVEQLPPSTGSHSRVLLLRSLLAGAAGGTPSDSTQNERRVYQELVELTRLFHSTARNPPARRVDVYAQSLLPYYEYNLDTYSSELKRQGAFRALETVTNASPTLLIVVANHNRDARGLCEGIILANGSGHRIILAVIGSSRDTLISEVLALKESGIQVVKSSGANLANAIHQAIVEIPTLRIRSPRQLYKPPTA